MRRGAIMRPVRKNRHPLDRGPRPRERELRRRGPVRALVLGRRASCSWARPGAGAVRRSRRRGRDGPNASSASLPGSTPARRSTHPGEDERRRLPQLGVVERGGGSAAHTARAASRSPARWSARASPAGEHDGSRRCPPRWRVPTAIPEDDLASRLIAALARRRERGRRRPRAPVGGAAPASRPQGRAVADAASTSADRGLRATRSASCARLVSSRAPTSGRARRTSSPPRAGARQRHGSTAARRRSRPKQTS